ncbi:ubiquinone/menaquinone biosynthesis C-methylase UbiE [Nonomuraea polychroma]|uniref:Ubiquinone/menaquinone biosynthesis C-methylase UbiE n=1 Tax=Nonomuraea polychroma TaxID=46176 RepID=A0A438MA95_9ACTN|nr:class I SAM-dependent methyltransferase [Nonomuraea polychroma]RVX42644.1 ubiquinone/menaquinone biosynthesis C-methylase UbiE [Nonomuraea polychroma]
MTIENTDQSAAWNGAEGAAWASAAPERDAEEGPEAELCERLLEAAGIGRRDRVLDIGCGTGATSRRAARRAAEGRVVGADLSAPMLSQARLAATAAGLGNVTFEQADAQAHPFPAAAFDAAISQYGVMFFADPVAAFANIGRALRPGGRLAFVCPQPPEDCAWYVVPVAALLGIDPRPHAVVTAYPGTPPAMFSLSDPLRIAQVLTEAGFTGVAVEPLRVPGRFGDTVAEAADAFLASGPSRYIVEQDDDLTWEEARARLTAALEPYAGAGGVLMPGAQWLVSAVRMAPDTAGER